MIGEEHARLVLVFALLATSGCAAPTLQQRQGAWRKHVTIQRATCVVGMGDPAMPADVREWCAQVGATASPAPSIPSESE